MKTNLILASLMICSTGLFAQVEHDDMYFKKEDRIGLKQQREQAAQAKLEAIAKGEKKARFDYPINYNNKVDDQLAHSINPEYLSQMVNGEGADQNVGYYFSNYRYNANFDPNFINFNMASIYGSSWYYDMYFSPYMNPWRNPYQNVFMYDQFFNPYRNRWMNPYYSNGWNNVSLMSCNVNSGSWSWNQAMSMPLGVYPNNQSPNMSPVGVSNDNQMGSVHKRRSSRRQNAEVASTTSNRNSRVFDASRNSAMASSNATKTRKTRTTQVEYYTPQWRRVEQQTSDNTTTAGNYPKSKMSNTENRSFSTNRSGSNSSTQRSTAAPSQRSSSSSNSPTSRSSSSGSGSSPSRSSRGSN